MNQSPNPKISFYYTQPSKSYSEGFQIQNQLNSTSRTSFASNINCSSSPSTTILTTMRKDQLRPTSKINLSHRISKDGGKSNQIFKKNQDLLSSNLSYNQIKPIFDLSKFIGMCGMERGEGVNGCQCFRQPCEWNIKWTKNYNPKNSKLYKSLKKERYDLKMAEQIEKDLPRTYTQCPTFCSNYQFRDNLRNILRVYSIYDIEAGYVQGMNRVAGALLYHIKKEEQSFWAFVDLMDQQELRLIYLSGFQSLKKHTSIISSLIKSKIKSLFDLMNQIDVSADIFLYGWLLSLMSNCVPLQYMHLVLQKFRTQGWIFLYKLVITYLLFLKDALLTSEDSSQFLSILSNANSQQIGSNWLQILENCHKLQL